MAQSLLKKHQVIEKINLVSTISPYGNSPITLYPKTDLPTELPRKTIANSWNSRLPLVKIGTHLKFLTLRTRMSSKHLPLLTENHSRPLPWRISTCSLIATTTSLDSSVVIKHGKLTNGMVIGVTLGGRTTGVAEPTDKEQRALSSMKIKTEMIKSKMTNGWRLKQQFYLHLKQRPLFWLLLLLRPQSSWRFD